MFQALWKMLGRPALCGAALLTVANLVHAQVSLPTLPQPAAPAAVKNQPIVPVSAQELAAPLPPLSLGEPAAPAAPSAADELKVRIERLEKQNQDLMNAIKGMQAQPPASPVATAAPQSGLNAQDVRTSVAL